MGPGLNNDLDVELHGVPEVKALSTTDISRDSINYVH